MILVRPARPDEFQPIRILERASAQRFVGLMDALAADDPSSAALLAERIAGDGLLVAASGESLAGFVMFRTVEDRLYVEQIDVLPAFGGRRIGATLLDAVADRAKAAGLAGLSLSTFRDVPWNAPYYRRLGFLEAVDPTPGMRAIRAEHLARGLDEDARVFMVRDALDGEGTRGAARPRPETP
jgi:ribosomal protein S18 acetylase RimI-like enzyme